MHQKEWELLDEAFEEFMKADGSEDFDPALYAAFYAGVAAHRNLNEER